MVELKLAIMFSIAVEPPTFSITTHQIMEVANAAEQFETSFPPVSYCHAFILLFLSGKAQAAILQRANERDAHPHPMPLSAPVRAAHAVKARERNTLIGPF